MSPTHLLNLIATQKEKFPNILIEDGLNESCPAKPLFQSLLCNFLKHLKGQQKILHVNLLGPNSCKDNGNQKIENYIQTYVNDKKLIVLNAHQLWFNRSLNAAQLDASAPDVDNIDPREMFAGLDLAHMFYPDPTNKGDASSGLNFICDSKETFLTNVRAIFIDGLEFPVIEDFPKTVQFLKSLQTQKPEDNFTVVCLLDTRLIDDYPLTGLKQLFGARIKVNPFDPELKNQIPAIGCFAMKCTTKYNREGKKPGQITENIYFEAEETTLSNQLPLPLRIKEVKAISASKVHPTKSEMYKPVVSTNISSRSDDREKRQLRLLQKHVPFSLTPGTAHEMEMRDQTHREGLPHKAVAEEHEQRIKYDEIYKNKKADTDDIDYEEPLDEPGIEDEEDPDDDLNI